MSQKFDQNHIGLRDLPLSSIENESLGLYKYVDSLSEFVKLCDTPMTIAIQGDWGSGKTSLMHLIKENLKTDKNIETITFNVWEHAQFGLEEQLSLSFLNFFVDHIIESIDPTSFERNKLLEQLRKRRDSIFRALGKVGRGLKGTALGPVGAIASMVSAFGDEKEDIDPVKNVRTLKELIEDSVSKFIKGSPHKRILIFVDDLDRLSPIIAVEVLEALKIFLDLAGCVFILACDYKIITQGLKQKFGDSIAATTEKNFFDKIIQLPFKMPVAQYQVDKYITDLLSKIKIEYEDADVEHYKRLIDYSMGFNPRGLKRSFNSLLLLKNVAEKTKQDLDCNFKSVNSNELYKILFACICMESTYNEFYTDLAKNVFTRDDFANINNDQDARENISSHYFDLSNPTPQLAKFEDFLSALFDSIQLDSDGDDSFLAPEEFEIFLSILNLSSMTSSSNDDVTIEELLAADFRKKRTRNYDTLKKFLNFNKAKNVIGKLQEKLMNGSKLTVYRIDQTTNCMFKLINYDSNLPFKSIACGILNNNFYISFMGIHEKDEDLSRVEKYAISMLQRINTYFASKKYTFAYPLANYSQESKHDFSIIDVELSDIHDDSFSIDTLYSILSPIFIALIKVDLKY